MFDTYSISKIPEMKSVHALKGKLEVRRNCLWKLFDLVGSVDAILWKHLLRHAAILGYRNLVFCRDDIFAWLVVSHETVRCERLDDDKI